MMQSVRNLLSREKFACQMLKMPRQLVNREEQGRLIAQTNGHITMINESNFTVKSKSSYTTYTSSPSNLDGFVHVETIFVVI